MGLWFMYIVGSHWTIHEFHEQKTNKNHQQKGNDGRLQQN